MRLYASSSEETLRARKLLTQWKDEGLLNEEQYRRLDQDTISDLRTTNLFLRIVLFLFTALAVGAAVALFFALFTSHPSESGTGAWFLVFAVLSYVAAEAVATQGRLYRYGIEEALAVCSVAFVCMGLGTLLSVSLFNHEHGGLVLVAAVGAGLSLWLWYRFGLWYAFPAVMVFMAFLPANWTSYPPVQRCLLCILYAGGLACVGTVRLRHRSDSLEFGLLPGGSLLMAGNLPGSQPEALRGERPCRVMAR